MLWIVVIGVAITIVPAAGILALVAVTSGHMKAPSGTKWERVIRDTDRHLNAKGTPPRFLQRLDARR